MVFVFPSEVNSMQVTEEFEDAYNKLRDMGYGVYTVNISEAKGLRIFPGLPKKNEKVALYMTDMSGEYYREIYTLFSSKGLQLVNTPEQYEDIHYFNEDNYDLFDDMVPYYFIINIEWEKMTNIEVKSDIINYINYYKDMRADDFLTKESREELFSLRELGYRYVIKDTSKKLRGYKCPNYFDSTYSTMELDRYLQDFKRLHADADGTYIIQRYMKLKQYQDETMLLTLGPHKSEANELRLWWIDGRLAFITDRTNGEIQNKAMVSKTFIRNLPRLNSSFYTLDIAEVIDDGKARWNIIGMDDGQVSYFKPDGVISMNWKTEKPDKPDKNITPIPVPEALNLNPEVCLSVPEENNKNKKAKNTPDGKVSQDTKSGKQVKNQKATQTQEDKGVSGKLRMPEKAVTKSELKKHKNNTPVKKRNYKSRRGSTS